MGEMAVNCLVEGEPVVSRRGVLQAPPSVVKMMFDGMEPATSPRNVSEIGRWVIEPPPRSGFSLHARSTSWE